LFGGALLIGPASLIGAIMLGQVLGAVGRTSALQAHAMSAAGMAQMARPATSPAAQPLVMMLHRRVVHIAIHNFAFIPSRLEVSPGTRLIWTNTDSVPHTVDSTKNVWTSDTLNTDGHFTRTFSKIGTYPYYCSIHPFMRATIIVKG
jgi:plastocyanin